MFTVKHKVSGNIYTVYDVRNDSNGYPHFLIYVRDNQWLYISAKHFLPEGE